MYFTAGFMFSFLNFISLRINISMLRQAIPAVYFVPAAMPATRELKIILFLMLILRNKINTERVTNCTAMQSETAHLE